MSIKKSLTPTRTEVKNLYLIISTMALVMMMLLGIIAVLPSAYANSPDIPVLSIGTITDTSAELTWSSSTMNNNNHNEDVYRCEGTSCIPDILIGNNVKTPYTDNSLSSETDYCYLVEEKHGRNFAGSSVVCITTTGGGSNESPIITLNLPNPQNLLVGDGYTELGATARDTEDGDISRKIIIDSTEFIDAVGTYTIYYEVTDSDSNTVQDTRIVVVSAPSNDPPILILNPPDPQTIIVGDGYTELGATARDTEDGDISRKIIIDSTEFIDAVGTYTIYYEVTDSDSNTVQDSRTIDVITFIQIPFLSAGKITETSIELNWTETAKNWKHDIFYCQGTICTPTIQIATNLPTPTFTHSPLNPNTNYRYMVTESKGNQSHDSNIITVKTDLGAGGGNTPILTIFGDNPLELAVGDGYSEQGASAIDIEDGNITNLIIIDSTEFIDAVGTYTIYYEVTDSNSNLVQDTRIVQVCQVDFTWNGSQCVLSTTIDIKLEINGSKAILVSWHLPMIYTSDNIDYRYEVFRSDDRGKTFNQIKVQTRDTERKVLDHRLDYKEINHFLDENTITGDVYIYKINAKKGIGGGSGNIKLSGTSIPIFIPDTYSGYLIKADGYGIETTTSGIIQPPLMLGWFAWIMPNVFGVDNPIFTSMLNPQGEVFEIDIEPMPTPTYSDSQCTQYLDVGFKRNADSGQTLSYTITILENGVPKHQFFDIVQVTAKRVFNNQYYIPFETQSLTDFTNISVQVDVNSQVGDPRSFELHYVDFYIPEDNGAC